MGAFNFVLFVAFLQVFHGCIATPVEGRELYAPGDHSSSLFEETGLLSWFDDCANLTVAYNDVYNYTLRLAPWLFEFSFVVGSDLSAFLTCSGLVSTIPCLVDNFEQMKKDVVAYQPAFEKFWEEGLKLTEEVKAGMESCFMQKTTLHALRFGEDFLKH
ncbi:uncharacterized protein LOC106669908 [Cimex lectularius]|uniref:Uncharacterized protein n=1 Tax=Cimex lectularius TaxID=79782 RepID=A0A8I6S3S0_CIMLE|nr:uncharacterized protein LOC106669908 [Cimex lectularius]